MSDRVAVRSFLVTVCSFAFTLAGKADAQSVRSVTLSTGAVSFLSAILGADEDALMRHRSDAYLANVDLDGDDQREHVVQLVSPLTCSDGAVVCAWVVYAGPPGRRAVLSTAAHAYRVLPKRTNGWHDLAFERHRGDTIVVDTYTYDTVAYRLQSSEAAIPD